MHSNLPGDEPAKVYLLRCEEYIQKGSFERAGELSARLEWNRDFETGIGDIDAQHKELFSASFALLDAIEKGMGMLEMVATIGGLDRLIKAHFATEERLMSASGYPFLEHQKGQHEKFLIAFEHLIHEI